MLEQNEKQYAASATVHTEKKSEMPMQEKQTKLTKPPQNTTGAKQKNDFESNPEQNSSPSGGYNLRGYCYKCGNKGHFARNYRNMRSRQESSGRATRNDSSRVVTQLRVLPLRTISQKPNFKTCWPNADSEMNRNSSETPRPTLVQLQPMPWSAARL